MKFGKVVLEKGGKMREHSNGDSEELLVVLKGRAVVVLGKTRKEISGGGHLIIPKSTVHSVENSGKGKLEYYYILPNKN
jgi:mannose-6-phosphate isomerase-like protein (cupin superfamily)